MGLEPHAGTSSNIGDSDADTVQQSADRSQPDPVDADDPSGPSELSGVPEPTDADETSGSSELSGVPKPVDADNPSEPSELSGVPEPADGSGLPIWALTVIVTGAVALLLVAGALARARLRRRAS